MGVSRPEVVQKLVDGVIHEPFEQVVIDVEEQHQGSVMEELGLRKAELRFSQTQLLHNWSLMLLLYINNNLLKGFMYNTIN